MYFCRHNWVFPEPTIQLDKYPIKVVKKAKKIVGLIFDSNDIQYLKDVIPKSTGYPTCSRPHRFGS